jgi:NAD(P)-dependent dehydrogenase (short-subunit alcohol dehydrogenase family)
VDDWMAETETKRSLQEPLARRWAAKGGADDVAAAVRFFATYPAYITGQILHVDGGASAV